MAGLPFGWAILGGVREGRGRMARVSSELAVGSGGFESAQRRTECRIGRSQCREAVAQRLGRSSRSELRDRANCVNYPGGLVQAPAAASWWRWSLARLWVAMSSRHSVRTLIRPFRWNLVISRL